MASLTDTYRMMRGEEPVNKERITEEDRTKVEINKRVGEPGKKVSQNFINDMKRIRSGETLVVEQVQTTKESLNNSIMDVMHNGEKEEEEQIST
jgi:hypothetical protein